MIYAKNIIKLINIIYWVIKIYNYLNYNDSYFYNPRSSGFNPRGNNNYDDRGGILLPFLAGVLVTTPFIFLNKNNNQQQYPIYQTPYYPQPYQQQYPQNIYSYPMMPYRPY